LGKKEDFDLEGLRLEVVEMDREQLEKPHQKAKSKEGNFYGISLPHGETLINQGVLYKDQERIVVIELVPEDVLEIMPEGNLQWAKAAFNIGNMHKRAYLREDGILLPYEEAMENLMKGLGIAYARKEKPLDGERANYTYGRGHHHEGED
ncbi:MAG: hypothetical protein RR472_00895, partial [Anaerovoracaceae bacterium]